jgi:hypothetical protein
MWGNRARVLAVVLMVFAGTALAEHEADHRYDVRGYVLSADKTPRPAASVTIRKGDQLIGSGKTDPDGFYAIELHLHDEDIGRTLAVRAGEHQALIRMQAQYGNKSTARVHHVNFIGGQVSEENLSRPSVPPWIYVVAAPFVLWAALHLAGVIRRKARKLRSPSAPEALDRGKKHRGKRKR